MVELLVFAELRDARPRVRFVARDTGVGIAPRSCPQIFDPFFTTGPGRGTGLGLSLAREIRSATAASSRSSVIGHGDDIAVVAERVAGAAAALADGADPICPDPRAR